MPNSITQSIRYVKGYSPFYIVLPQWNSAFGRNTHQWGIVKEQFHCTMDKYFSFAINGGAIHGT